MANVFRFTVIIAISALLLLKDNTGLSNFELAVICLLLVISGILAGIDEEICKRNSFKR